MGEDTIPNDDMPAGNQKNYLGPERRKENERLCSELEHQLRRCITGMAMLAETSESTVKAHADSLQQALHNGENSIDLPDVQVGLQQLAEEIAVSVKAAKFQGDTQSLEQKIPALTEVLIELVEKLNLPVEMSASADTLKQRLEKRFNAEDLPEVLQLVAVLVAEMRSHVDQERLDIEDFLRQLTERLSGIDLFLQGEEATRAIVMQRAQELDEAVEAHVHGIKKAVQTSSDLNELKLIIEERIEAIRARVEEYRRDEQQYIERIENERRGQAERQVKVLTSRLHELEAETSELRERVVHERSQALHDSLTGLSNRRAYKERMTLEYSRWQRYDTPLTLLIWDIDRFKAINDTYGHKAGDKALATIAHLLRDQIRTTDFLARYGGEEFVILMPQTPQPAAASVAETLRTSVEACNFHFRGTLVPITISCGGAVIDASDTPESLFERADAALYEAKKQGGNLCIFAAIPAHKQSAPQS